MYRQEGIHKKLCGSAQGYRYFPALEVPGIQNAPIFSRDNGVVPTGGLDGRNYRNFFTGHDCKHERCLGDRGEIGLSFDYFPECGLSV